MNMTAVSYFFGETATIQFKQDGGTAIAVGVMQGVEIRAKYETVDLEGCGSIKRQGIATKKVRPSVKGTVKKIDIDLLGDILSPTRAKYTGGTLTEIEDTDLPSFFDVVAAVKDENGKTLTVTVHNVVFPDLPLLVASWGEYVEWELSGEGDDASFVKAT